MEVDKIRLESKLVDNGPVSNDIPFQKRSYSHKIKDDYDASTGFQIDTLPWLLNNLGTKIMPPLKFKECILGVLQLYYDGIVESQESFWRNREPILALDILLKAVQTAVSSLSRDPNLNPSPDLSSKVRTMMEPWYKVILNYGSQQKRRRRDLDGSDKVARAVHGAYRALEKESIDLIIPVASGGFELGVLLANDLGVDDLFPIRYSRLAKGDKYVRSPKLPTIYLQKRISGKKVLLTEDVVFCGETLVQVTDWLKEYNPEKIVLATVFDKSLDGYGFGYRSHYSGLVHYYSCL